MMPWILDEYYVDPDQMTALYELWAYDKELKLLQLGPITIELPWP
jgi:hypothetical protein